MPRKSPVWAGPLLFSLFFSLECYNELRPFGTFAGLALTIVYTALFALTVYGFARRAFRDAGKAAVFSAIVLVTTYFFSYLVFTLRKSDLPFASPRAVLALVVVLWAALFVLLWRIRRDLLALGRLFLVVSVVLTVFAAARAFKPGLAKPASQPLALLAPTNAPDVYFIVLDAHTSLESLRRYWKHDPSPFESALVSLGFHVRTNAPANFDSTTYALASMLNMDYPAVATANAFGLAQGAYLVNQVSRGLVKGTFRQAGYDTVDLSFFPGFDGEPAVMRHSSIVAVSVPGLALMKTPAGEVAEYFWVRQQGRASLQILETAARVARTASDRPRFVYAHALLPHAPYFFDRSGNSISKGFGSGDESTAANDYLEQLIFTDRVVTNLVSEIIAASRRPAVILVQGDHGYRHLAGTNQIAESLTALSAIRLPGGNTNVIPYDGMTPVNAFRLIFNRYFDAGLPDLPDRSTSVLLKNGAGAQHHEP